MRIHLAPDCAITLEKRIQVEAMTLSPPVSLSDAKLDVLRRLDQFRQWRSLDEKRYCLVCGKIITGRQIEVAGGTRGNGALRLSCPTERCNSIPMDWVLPTDEIIARFEMMAAEERKAVESKRVARANEMAQLPKAEDNGIASRFLKFAFHFKRAS